VHRAEHTEDSIKSRNREIARSRPRAESSALSALDGIEKRESDAFPFRGSRSSRLLSDSSAFGHTRCLQHPSRIRLSAHVPIRGCNARLSAKDHQGVSSLATRTRNAKHLIPCARVSCLRYVQLVPNIRAAPFANSAEISRIKIRELGIIAPSLD